MADDVSDATEEEYEEDSCTVGGMVNLLDLEINLGDSTCPSCNETRPPPRTVVVAASVTVSGLDMGAVAVPVVFAVSAVVAETACPAMNPPSEHDEDDEDVLLAFGPVAKSTVTGASRVVTATSARVVVNGAASGVMEGSGVTAP